MIKTAHNLSDELKRLAAAEKTADFRFDPDIGALPAAERETALLVKRVLDNHRAAAEYALTRYKLTGESLGVGHWDMLITGSDAGRPHNAFIWSPELRRMLGYAGEGDFADTLGNWLLHIHPDDRENALKDFVAHAADRTGKTQFVTEYRLRRTDGDYITVRAFGTSLRDGTGAPVRIAGAVEDITEAQKVREALLHREKMLDILNRASLMLLSREEKSFAAAMSEGINLIAGIADMDRMSIFRNSEKPDGRYVTQLYRWSKDADGTVDVLKELEDVSYAQVAPRLEPLLASGECVGGQVEQLSNGELFRRFGCVTVLLIPVFDDGKFWGVTLFERFTDGNFTERETEILRSASVMLANAVIRNDEAATVRQANEQYQLMLDASPLATTMWDRNFNVINCSKTALEVFGFSTKQALMEDLFALAPEYQPSGKRSLDVLAEEMTKAFETGYTRLEWTHRSTGGEVMPFDLVARRVKYKDDCAVILYPRDIREEKKMLTELAERDKRLAAALRQADAANEAKSAFLAQMSHEMRTPLSAVISLSELVLENGGLGRDGEVYLDKIYNAGSTLLSIVNDILDISKIEAGKFEIMPQDYDVPGLINDAITQNILRIHSKPVRFSLNISESAPARLRGDDIRVKQVLSNLLSNAFKYTEEGDVELSVDCDREGDSVWTTFRVSDTGIGIRPDDLSRLFCDYTRFDGEANRKTGGTGLGLSITKRLVELMDGYITAKSKHGAGSVFTAKIRQAYVGDAVIGREMAEHLKSFLYTTSRRRTGAQLDRVRMPCARVLVVDDNLTNLDIARGLMRPYEMIVDCVTGGQAAVDAVRAESIRYDAIFMDHMMPDMDGVEAVRIIRGEIGSEYAQTVPIIALTANAVVGSKERFISQGFNSFVSKPIDIFRLDAEIRRWIWTKYNERERDGLTERRRRPDRRKGGDRRVGDRRVGERRSQADRRSAVSPRPAVIEGLDWTAGTELFGGEGAFCEVLRSFAVNTRPLLDELRAVRADSLPLYAITVHGIKSAARGICAYTLGDKAEALEFAAKDNNWERVSLGNAGFVEAAGKLIDGIVALLDGHAAGARTSKPQRERPDGAELSRLRAACEDYDLDGIEAVMRAIGNWEYTADGGLVAWLQGCIARLDYAAVAERLATE